MSETDRAERPTGLLAWLRSALATALAAEPVPPPAWTPPRGLGLLPGLLADVTSASARTVSPANPKAMTASGYEHRAIRISDWAPMAGLELEVAALAWCLASESSRIGRYPQYAWAIAESVVNAAREIQGDAEDLGTAVTRRICADKRLKGWYPGKQGGRWCSSYQPPTLQHVRCAELVLERARAGEPDILARGATQWLDAGVQVAMNRKRPATNPPPEEIVRRRYASGRRWIGPTVDAVGTVVLDDWVLMMFGPEGVDEEQAQASLRDGRLRWRVRPS